MKTSKILKRFIPYYKKYTGILFMDLFCASLTTVCEMVFPLILRYITNEGMRDLTSLTVEVVGKAALLYLVLRVIDGVAFFYMAYTGHIMGAKIETDMRRDAFQHLQKLSDSYYSNGSLGTLKIPAIDLTVKIYQGTSDATLKKGAGHFASTSVWDGNVSLAAHNRGANNYFGKIHTLEMGDRITLSTKEGTRTYSVTSVMKIDETDNSMLAATSENCLTLFTCVRNERDYRWCIRAVEV